MGSDESDCDSDYIVDPEPLNKKQRIRINYTPKKKNALFTYFSKNIEMKSIPNISKIKKFLHEYPKYTQFVEAGPEKVQQIIKNRIKYCQSKS